MSDRSKTGWVLEDLLSGRLSRPVASPNLRGRDTADMDDADGHGSVTGTCGDSVEIFVKVDAGRVTRASHRCQGCVFTVLCAAAAVSLIEGKTLAEARRAVRPKSILDAAGGLPDDHLHCATIATHSAHEALEQAMASEREPWRKAYGK